MRLRVLRGYTVVEAVMLAMLALGLPTAGVSAPIQLTSHAGDDTEAAWSPDGAMIAFQRESDGDVDLCVLDVESGEVTTLVDGPGHALHPAWSPDGETIVYSFAHFTSTAAEGIESGYNLFAVRSDGGQPRRLTEGQVRDYTPAFARDGDAIVFSSTRGLEEAGAALMRIPPGGGEPAGFDLEQGRDTGFVEPDFSPDGSLIVCSYIPNFRENWTLRLLRAGEPEEQFGLTSPEAAMYAPAWSPDGRLIACTGYRAGDPGWGIYLVEVESGLSMRLDTGPGNARSPAWSPEGDRLVFESNRGGSYDLYVVETPQTEFGPPPDVPADATVLSLEVDPNEGTVRDGSDHSNEIVTAGEPEIDETGIAFNPGDFIAAEQPGGMAFGDDAFCVRADVSIREVTGDVQIIAVGDYPEHRQGWQLFLNDEGYLYFNSRDAEGTFISARSDLPLGPGGRLLIVALRRDTGRVELWLDGLRQQLTGTGATMRYGEAAQVRIGSQHSGGMDFAGTVHALEILNQAPSDEAIRAPHLKEFVQQ
ncbi:MAG: LamG-like jellyroll fold domain-containing protein [Armatimonadota bacterium]